MPSVPCSPRTPTRRQKSFSVDLPMSPRISNKGHSSRRPSQTSIGSFNSIDSLHSPWTQTSLEPLGNAVSTNSQLLDPSAGSGKDGGLGSLADELAEVLDEDEQGEAGDGASTHSEDFEAESSEKLPLSEEDRRAEQMPNGHRTSVADLASSSGSYRSPKAPSSTKAHRQSAYLKGSGGVDYDMLDDAYGLPQNLESQILRTEQFARRADEAIVSEAQAIVKNMSLLLKDLPSQTGVENGTSRLLTSHAAITNHLSHQSRTLLSLTHPLVSPLSLAPLDPSTIDELLPLLNDLSAALPFPFSQCSHSLRTLTAVTADLQATLTYLSDTIYMIRQTSVEASRKLKSAIDAAGEIQRDATARDEGMRWIESGGWDARLARRECAKVCGEVVGGFEDVCRDWREQLVVGAASVGVGVA